MDIGRALNFITEDEKWLTKMAIGGVLMLVPVVNLLVLYGYMLETADNVAQERPQPLPGWSNFVDKLIKGVYALIISIVYAIPVFLFTVIVKLIVGNSEGLLSGLVWLLAQPMTIGLSIATWLLIAVALVRFIQTDNLSSAFQFQTIATTVRNDPKTWLMVFIMYVVCVLFGLLGSIACGIGIIFTMFFGFTVFGHILGQVASEGMEAFVEDDDEATEE